MQNTVCGIIAKHITYLAQLNTRAAINYSICCWKF